jgi:hypothetical protein
MVRSVPPTNSSPEVHVALTAGSAMWRLAKIGRHFAEPVEFAHPLAANCQPQ